MDEKPSEFCSGDIGGEKSPSGRIRGHLANVNRPIIFRDIRLFKYHSINVELEPFRKSLEYLIISIQYFFSSYKVDMVG